MTKNRLLAFATLLVLPWGSQNSVAQDESTPEQAGNVPQQKMGTDQAVQSNIFKPEGNVIIPESSLVRPQDAGIRAHTNHLVFVPAGRPMSSVNPDYTFAETPLSMACIYKVGTAYTGCTPSGGGPANLAKGGWGTIALVSAYDNPNAASDLAFFSTYWGLPAANFTQVYANTSFGTLNGLTASCSGTPAGDMNWGLEQDLDTEWAHAMAPSAKIILVEACSNSIDDLLFAEEVAGIKLGAAGGDISNSWSGPEFATELTGDNYFYRYYYNKITYFTGAGDSGWGAAWPSSSPWVVSVGGTTINRDVNGNFVNETCWSKSGGGVSQYELWQSPPNIENGMGPWANYQYEMAGQSARQTPDVAFNADPASGVYVYDTYWNFPGWLVVGGTSLGSPAVAGIVNASNNQLGQTPPGGGKYAAGELDLIYPQLYAHTAYKGNFYDVVQGSNGTGHNAGAGYDQCTGIGSPRGKLGK